jgi:glycosyltransferase involved in cell wall biosynthesis
VEDGVTGLLVAPGDTEALSAALEKLLGDPERRDAMGREGHRRALASHTAHVMAQNYEGVYRQVFRRSSARRWTARTGQ